VSDSARFKSTRTGNVYHLGRPFRISTYPAHEAQATDGRHCWIKQVSGDDEAAVAMLRYETIILDKLDHPHIIRLIDRGRSRTRFFLVLEPPPGRPLPDMLASGPVALDLVRTIAVQLADMLVYLHSQGIICRSLSPSALYIDHVGRITCIDLSMAWDEVSPVRREEVIEDVLHMSPEQAGGAVADRRSDIYVYGVLLFELLTRRPPFQGTNRGDLALQHLLQPPPDLCRLRPDISPEFADLINRCLAKSPVQRPATAANLRAMLDAIDQPALEPPANLATPPFWHRLFRPKSLRKDQISHQFHKEQR
jgi:eukaryotic-like serine/threonine-protein kinase